MNFPDATITRKDDPMPVRSLSGPRPARRFRLFAALAAALAARRSRRDLARLDPRLLRDIGLTESEARAEAIRPVWDAPDHWKR